MILYELGPETGENGPEGFSGYIIPADSFDASTGLETASNGVLVTDEGSQGDSSPSQEEGSGDSSPLLSVLEDDTAGDDTPPTSTPDMALVYLEQISDDVSTITDAVVHPGTGLADTVSAVADDMSVAADMLACLLFVLFAAVVLTICRIYARSVD